MDAGAGHLAEGMSITMKFLSEDNETQSINNLPYLYRAPRRPQASAEGRWGFVRSGCPARKAQTHSLKFQQDTTLQPEGEPVGRRYIHLNIN
jgi:hypothetical protein